MLLNAVMCVWNEEDIIESTVKHAFAQGCSNVFIIDNGSADKTVEIALAAGAQLAERFASQYFDEGQKIAHLNTVVRDYNRQCAEDQVWWLYLDADEFPNIDAAVTLAGFLGQLDASVRGVHGPMLEHVPTHAPYHVPGYHPVDFMPLAVASGASKIPLLRYDKGKPHFYSAGGAHTFDTCGDMVPIAKDVLHIHHFNYRRPEHSIPRLKQLLSKRPDGTSRVDTMDEAAKRVTRAPDALSDYHARYQRVRSLYAQGRHTLWTTDELPYAYGHVVRWYDPHTVHSADDTLQSRCFRHFFLGDHATALESFAELLEGASDPVTRLLITINMGVCLQGVDKNAALNLVRPLLDCRDTEIRAYARKQFERISAGRPSSFAAGQQGAFCYSIQQYFGTFDKQVFIHS